MAKKMQVNGLNGLVIYVSGPTPNPNPGPSPNPGPPLVSPQPPGTVPLPGQQCSAPYVVIVGKFCDGVLRPNRCAGTIIDDDWVLTSKFCV